LSVSVCFHHANTIALDIRTQRSPVPASRPNIQPQENKQDQPQQLADSSATFLQQTDLRLPALVRDPTRFDSATADLAFNIDTEPADVPAVADPVIKSPNLPYLNVITKQVL
jgi:hypothetical protein